jgi:DNA-binding transcriptional regulator YhcF (GntR family)
MTFAFTDRTRKVLAMAREEALRLQTGRVDTEHILLGLIREGEGVAARVLTQLSVDLQEIRKQLEESARGGKATIALGELAYTKSAKKVLELAMVEARELSHSHCGTEHLLLGLLREGKAAAAEVLTGSGVTLERARQETVRLLRTEPPRSKAQSNQGGWLRRLLGGEPDDPAWPGAFKIEIDDTSSLSIYEQIVAEVQEAIATGRLSSGDRLPTVRRLAEELDIAPGTVARAYGELERLGAVVTEGSRGTRVASRPRKPLPEEERPDTLVGLLRPVAVAAFHLGATGDELRRALERAMRDIFAGEDDGQPT